MTNTSFYSMPGTKAPVRMWVDPAEVEQTALAQIRTVADMPWADGVAVMPDVHAGKGATIGTVIASRNAVCPAAVGVDIGCGMTALPVMMRSSDLPEDLSKVRAAIENAIPLGQTSHSGNLVRRFRDAGVSGFVGLLERYESLTVSLSTRRLNSESYKDRVFDQIGTLGGGNHFIEVCSDEDGFVWLMLHSGSRNVGKEIAERHIEIAASLPENRDVPDKHLAAFFTGSVQMDAYRRDLMWAQDYARLNREVMMGLVRRAFVGVVGNHAFGKPISCHHNYVSVESYDGVEMIVTRKGAISTEGGRLGVIPGSMGTGSFIVRGRSVDLAYRSASHGAGRTMSRSEAKRRFTEVDLAAQTMGVECRKDAGVVDEIPGAYKPLAKVMEDQRELVEIVTKLDTLVCVKG